MAERDDAVDGILLQHPVPRRSTSGRAVFEAIAPGKDVDGVALAHREPAALGTGCDLRRGPIQIRTNHCPQVMASLRNLAISALRLAGHTNIAHANRHHANRPERPITLLLTS